MTLTGTANTGRLVAYTVLERNAKVQVELSEGKLSLSAVPRSRTSCIKSFCGNLSLCFTLLRYYLSDAEPSESIQYFSLGVGDGNGLEHTVLLRRKKKTAALNFWELVRALGARRATPLRSARPALGRALAFSPPRGLLTLPSPAFF